MNDIYNYILKKEREFVSQYMDTSSLTDIEVDKLFDKLVADLCNDEKDYE